MGLFDSLLNRVENTIQGAVTSSSRKAMNDALKGADKMANDAVKNIRQKKETFTFTKLPENLEELKALPQANLTNPFGVVALVILAMNNINNNYDNAVQMLNFLKGPAPLMNQEIARMKEQLTGKDYHMLSYFEGTSPENNYKPTEPYKITVFDHPNSYDNQKDGYVTLWVKSSGADSDRQVRLRKKGSTGEWFLNEEYLTAGIRIPKEKDAWA
ncbi:MAG: hypothetical protein K6F17_03070 [Lachnospiraceae bacterium]|nr:hypothetical protein [Lachnospiraceae bacterium]